MQRSIKVRQFLRTFQSCLFAFFFPSLYINFNTNVIQMCKCELRLAWASDKHKTLIFVVGIMNFIYLTLQKQLSVSSKVYFIESKNIKFNISQIVLWYHITAVLNLNLVQHVYLHLKEPHLWRISVTCTILCNNQA